MSEKKKEREGERERWGNVKESKREREREGERLEAKIMVAFDNFFWSELISRLKVFFPSPPEKLGFVLSSKVRPT